MSLIDRFREEHPVMPQIVARLRLDYGVARVGRPSAPLRDVGVGA